MRFRIAHLLWLVFLAAVFFGGFRHHHEHFHHDAPIWSSIVYGAMMTAVVISVIASLGLIMDGWKRNNRWTSEEFVEQYTSGRNVRIEDRWNT